MKTRQAIRQYEKIMDEVIVILSEYERLVEDYFADDDPEFSRKKEDLENRVNDLMDQYQSLKDTYGIF